MIFNVFHSPTHLKYMKHGNILTDSATILSVAKHHNNQQTVVLDQTIFYPQGGGQPYDKGFIKNNDNIFVVEEVRLKDSIVYHIGFFQKGSFNTGVPVILHVDKARRIFNSRNHTAGHLIDIVMRNLGINLTPTKGYHFPQGAYVEYEGILDAMKHDALQAKLEKATNDLIKQTIPITIAMVDRDKLTTIASYVPDYIPHDKPSRVMIVQKYPAIPCGGTHVQNTKEVGSIIIDKVKNKKGNLRISYSIQEK